MKVNKYGHLVNNSPLQIIKCFTFRDHNYKQAAQYTSADYKMYCTVCGKEFALNTTIKSLLPWDEEFERLSKM